MKITPKKFQLDLISITRVIKKIRGKMSKDTGKPVNAMSSTANTKVLKAGIQEIIVQSAST